MGTPLIADPALAGKLASIERRLALGAALRGLDDGVAQLAEAPGALAALRAGGWTWLGGLEGEIQALKRLLPAARGEAIRARDGLVAPLARQLAQIKKAAEKPGDPSALSELNRALFQLDRALVSAERLVEGGQAPVIERAGALRDRLEEGRRALARFGDAGFRLGAGERALLAFDVRWLDAPGVAEPPPGALLLSDQRLRFERRDDRVLRRNRAGLAEEIRVDRALLMDEPHASLGAVRDATSGVVRREPRVALTWRAGAHTGATCTFSVEGGAAPLVAACEAMRQGRVRAYA